MTGPDRDAWYIRQAEAAQWPEPPLECCEPSVALGKLQAMRVKALLRVRNANPAYRLIAAARLEALDDVLAFLEPLLEGL